MHLVIVSRAIYPLHGYGGMERHCHDWIVTMAELGCVVSVVTMPPQEFYPDFPNSVRFHFVPGKQSTKVVARITHYPQWVAKVRTFLSNFLREESVDAIYANGLTVAGCTGLPVPVFYNPHGMEEFKTRGLKFLAYTPFRSMSRAGAKAASKVIATDKSLVVEIQKFLRVSNQKIITIPNSVRIKDIGGRLKPTHDDSANPLFLAVGRLEANKGFHILLRALSSAKGLPGDWKLIIAGTGSMEAELRKLADSSGIGARVIFAGKVKLEEINALYQRANLFIHPTLYEGSSIVTLEAMMNGLPVIATTAGGLADKVRPEINGWLVPPGDSVALSNAIVSACNVQNQWEQMGLSSAEIVQEQFSWDRSGKLFLETFRQAK